MARYAVVDGSGNVVNIVEWDGVSAWAPPSGFTVRAATDADHIEAPPIDISETIVTPRQARLALLNAGKLDAVNAAVVAAGAETQVWWDYSTEIHRDHPLIAALGAQLGMSSADLDQLFAVASRL